MSTLTKVFVVLVLVISLVYLGVSATLFAHRVDFKAKLDEKTAEFAAFKETANKDKAALEADIQTKAKEIQARDQNLNEAKAAMDASKRELENLNTKYNTLNTNHTNLVAEQQKLQSINEDQHRRNENLNKQLAEEKKLREDAQRVRDTVQAELLASQDRLEKAYKDISEMEKQIVEVSKSKNDIEQQLAYIRTLVPNIGNLGVEPKIDGVVLGVSDKVNLILISVGGKDNQHRVGEDVGTFPHPDNTIKRFCCQIEDLDL